MAKLLFTILLIVYGVNSQKCGPSIFQGSLPYERYNAPCDVQIGPQPCQSPVPCQTCPAQPGPIINLPPASFNIGLNVQPYQQPTPPCQPIVPQVPINLPIQPPCGPIAPPCGPIQPPCGPIQPPCGPIQPPFIPKPCNPPNLPTVGTIVDNTLANSLANAIQLLIVSNLIENTANIPNCASNNFNYDSSNCLTNIYDLTSPDYYCDPYETIYDIPCVQEQPCIQNPCAESPVFPISVQIPGTDCSCGNFGNSNGNFGNFNGNFGDLTCNCANGNGNFGSCNGNYANLITDGIFGKILNGNCNCGNSNGNCNSNFANLIPETGIFGNIVNGNCNCGNSNGNFGNFVTGNTNFGIPISCDGAVGTLAPVIAEVPFPEAIPAQLICNFGYMPTTVPCVSVNVEPLPFI